MTWFSMSVRFFLDCFGVKGLIERLIEVLWDRLIAEIGLGILKEIEKKISFLQSTSLITKTTALLYKPKQLNERGENCPEMWIVNE